MTGCVVLSSRGSSLESGVDTPEFPFDTAADDLPRNTAQATSKAVTVVDEGRTAAAFDRITHRCNAMKHVISLARRVDEFDVPVMIPGKSVTGKELLAVLRTKTVPSTDVR